jgi:uncharacterized membrane protein
VRLLLVNAAATWFLTGLIWVIQVVHYPLFSYAERATYRAFAEAHGRRISMVVGPAMLVELVTTAWLLASRPAALSFRAAWLGASLLVVTWLATALVQVPLHARLGEGYDSRAHAWLVTSNWIRTVAWTARSVLLMRALARALHVAT